MTEKDPLSTKLSAKYQRLKVGDKLRINGKQYTIKTREAHAKKNYRQSDKVLYGLGNNFILSFDWDWVFIHAVTKKGFLGFASNHWTYIPIDTIEIVK